MDTRRTASRVRIITLLGTTTAAVVGIFGLWRASRGEWSQAALDGLIVATMLGVVWLAARRRRVELAGTLMCVLNSVFCVAAAAIIGSAANGWIYVALVSNFYIASARVAGWCSGTLVLVAAALMVQVHAEPHIVSTVVTWALVCAFTYTFANHVQVDTGKLEAMANVDVLTQVPNRRAMEAFLERLLRERRQPAMGLLVIDLDKFKRVNDTYGHAAGDEVLASLAGALKAELRRNDHVFRFGGEEFVIVLPAHSNAALHATADRIRASVEASVESPGGPVTVSVGGALYDGELDWQTWFSRADEALYQAKRDGGNAVSCSSSRASGPA